MNATGQARYCGFADFPDQGFCKGVLCLLCHSFKSQNVQRCTTTKQSTGIEPVPCKVSTWGDWGACSLSCATDGGTIPPNSIPDGQQVLLNYKYVTPYTCVMFVCVVRCVRVLWCRILIPAVQRVRHCLNRYVFECCCVFGCDLLI